MIIHVGVVRHRHGLDVWAARTEEELYKRVREQYVEMWWDQEVGDDEEIPEDTTEAFNRGSN